MPNSTSDPNSSGENVAQFPVSVSQGPGENGKAAAEATRLPLAMQYGLAVVFVALAVVLAFVVEHLISAPNLTLIFVLPVVIAATSFGWGPSLAAVATSVLAFDFFFTEPRLSFAIASPSDLWAAALLLVTAAIVSTVAAESRRRAVESRKAAEQAEALQSLAHVVIESRPRAEVVKAAATALRRAFGAPSAIFMETDGTLALAAVSGRANITTAEEDAARGALATGVEARAETYPNDSSKFDFWPVTSPGGARCVLGVDFSEAEDGRPAAPGRLVEIIGGYLAASFSQAA